jgi:hypothetical protein
VPKAEALARQLPENLRTFDLWLYSNGGEATGLKDYLKALRQWLIEQTGHDRGDQFCVKVMEQAGLYLGKEAPSSIKARGGAPLREAWYWRMLASQSPEDHPSARFTAAKRDPRSKPAESPEDPTIDVAPAVQAKGSGPTVVDLDRQRRPSRWDRYDDSHAAQRSPKA